MQAAFSIQGDMTENGTARQPELIDRDAEEADDGIPGDQDHAAHDQRIDRDLESQRPLVGLRKPCGQRQEDGKIHKGIHDCEERA